MEHKKAQGAVASVLQSILWEAAGVASDAAGQASGAVTDARGTSEGEPEAEGWATKERRAESELGNFGGVEDWVVHRGSDLSHGSFPPNLLGSILDSLQLSFILVGHCPDLLRHGCLELDHVFFFKLGLLRCQC